MVTDTWMVAIGYVEQSLVLGIIISMDLLGGCGTGDNGGPLHVRYNGRLAVLGIASCGFRGRYSRV